MRPLRGVLAALAAVGLHLGAAPDPSVDYRLTPVFAGGALRHLTVEMRFRGDADGTTRLELSEWGREPSPWSKVSGFEAAGAEVVQDGPRIRMLRHRPNALLRVRYSVNSAHKTFPAGGELETVHRPLILRDGFAVYGDAAFATVEGRDEGPARFRWGRIPPGWRVASDAEHPGPLTPNRVTNSILVGAPDLRVVERTVLGGPVRVALRGEFAFSDAAFADDIARIAAAQRNFWADRGAAYLVTMFSLPPGPSSIGTGRGDAFVLFSPSDRKLEDLTRLLGHEMIHSWIDDEIGGRREDEEGLEYWLSEGFADFYALRTLLGARLLSLEDFAREMNELLLRQAASPVRDAPNARIKAESWKNADLEQLPYDRGHLFAALLDRELRQASGGRLDLDDVMRAQLKQARTRPPADKTSAGRLLPIMVRDVAGLDIEPLLARHIVEGRPFDLPADLYGACARIAAAVQPDFHRGFDIEATSKNGNVVTGVRPDSPAYAAGLRDGMTLVRRELNLTNDPGLEIGYRVKDGGAERLIRYLPAGRERLSVQRVTLTPGMSPERRAACARSMSGG